MGQVERYSMGDWVATVFHISIPLIMLSDERFNRLEGAHHRSIFLGKKIDTLSSQVLLNIWLSLIHEAPSKIVEDAAQIHVDDIDVPTERLLFIVAQRICPPLVGRQNDRAVGLKHRT